MYDYAKKTTVAILKIIGYYREGEFVYIVICQHTNISMKRISEILDYEREQDSENDQCYQELEKVDGDIVLKNVTFHYGKRKPVLGNIRVSRMNATLDEVKEAAKAADAHDFIKKLPMQYYTYLEEAGNGLSGGEK